jgi:hypothetical protein
MHKCALLAVVDSYSGLSGVLSLSQCLVGCAAVCALSPVS